MGITDHPTCLLRILYASQEATIRTLHGTTDCFKIGKGVHQSVYCHPAYLTCMEKSCENVRLDEAQAGIKIARRNINNLRYADDTTLMSECKEELKSLLMRVKEESEKAGVKLNIKKMKIMASDPIISWQIKGKKVEVVTDFIFLGSKITAHGDCSHKIQRHFLFGNYDKPRQYIIKQRHHFSSEVRINQSCSFSSSPVLT